MKVKLDKQLVKEYWFHLGGDMSETMGIAINHKGEPITYAEFMTSGGSIKPIHVLELEDEHLVVDHRNPLPKHEYEGFKAFFKEIE